MVDKYFNTFKPRSGKWVTALAGSFLVAYAPVALAALSAEPNQAGSALSADNPPMRGAGLGLQIKPVPTTFRTTFESWKVSDDERMGMLGLNLLFDVHPNLKLGVGSYGALTGERGGFITLGLASEFQWPVNDRWVLRSGLFAGAGGGAGGYELAGGGFMFRADAGVTYRMGSLGNIGLGASWVTFPTGEVKSAQPYIMYEYPFHTPVSSGWQTGSSGFGTRSGGVSSSRQEFSLGWTGYKIPDSVKNSSGGPQSNSMQLAGARLSTYLNDRWFLMLGADGAFAGDSAGYMQILGGGGYRLPLGSSTGLKAYATLGPAGGGAVATGGGLVYAGGIALQQMITDQIAIEVGLGGIKAGTGDFKAWSAGVNLTYVFGTPRASSGQILNTEDLAGYRMAPLRVRAMNQTYLKASDQWRTRDVDQSVNNLGFALDYFITPKIYLSGQGLAAYSGNAGAYMTGLLGAGVQQPISRDWFVTAEGLVGAAGGGTMATGNGAVWQLNAGLGYRITENLSVTVTGGRMQAFQGEFKANVVGVSLGYRFGLPTRAVH